MYFCWPWRKEPPAAVRLSLPMQVQARVTEGKEGERGKETPNSPFPAALPGIQCPPSPEAIRHPVGAAAAGKRRSARPGTPPAAAARRGRRAPALLSGRERRLRAGGARRERGSGSGAAGGRRWLGLLLLLLPAQELLGKGRPARTAAAGRGALRRPRLRPIHFFFSLPFLSFPSLLLLLSCSQTSSINAVSFVCVCLCRGEGDVAFNYYFSNNQRITRDPPSSYDALLERGCPPPQPLAQKGAPRGYCPGSPSGFAAGPAGAAGSGGRALTRRSPLAGR